MGAQLVKVMQYKVYACMELPDKHTFGMHASREYAYQFRPGIHNTDVRSKQYCDEGGSQLQCNNKL